jgi:hypothetical protein
MHTAKTYPAARPLYAPEHDFEPASASLRFTRGIRRLNAAEASRLAGIRRSNAALADLAEALVTNDFDRADAILDAADRRVLDAINGFRTDGVV